MRKLERRAFICLMMAGILLAGIILFIVRFIEDGGKWATFYGNPSVYTNGHLNRGAVYDRNDELLVKNTPKGTIYNIDKAKREATVQVVGDEKGNISTSVLNLYKDKLIGYNLLTGTYSFSDSSQDIKLTIDAGVSKIASQALGDRNGLVGVYNYKTGEILCMVSNPTYDPKAVIGKDDIREGMYLNKLLSGVMTPGSIFKLLTAAAAIENLPDLDSFSYVCHGYRQIGNEKLKCYMPHGVVDFKGALSSSCNGAFSILADKIGANTMEKYVEKCGLNKSYDVSGVKTPKGRFVFNNNPYELGWAGSGQHKDLINPCSMMVYMGAIANGGKSPNPYFIKSLIGNGNTKRMISKETAEKLGELMKNDVVNSYGSYRFPNLDIYAKTGTAEVGDKTGTTGWLSGYIKNEGSPYAFIVAVEDGAIGIEQGARVANEVLQYLVK